MLKYKQAGSSHNKMGTKAVLSRADLPSSQQQQNLLWQTRLEFEPSFWGSSYTQSEKLSQLFETITPSRRFYETWTAAALVVAQGSQNSGRQTVLPCPKPENSGKAFIDEASATASTSIPHWFCSASWKLPHPAGMLKAFVYRSMFLQNGGASDSAAAAETLSLGYAAQGSQLLGMQMPVRRRPRLCADACKLMRRLESRNQAVGSTGINL